MHVGRRRRRYDLQSSSTSRLSDSFALNDGLRGRGHTQTVCPNHMQSTHQFTHVHAQFQKSSCIAQRLFISVLVFYVLFSVHALASAPAPAAARISWRFQNTTNKNIKRNCVCNITVKVPPHLSASPITNLCFYRLFSSITFHFVPILENSFWYRSLKPLHKARMSGYW